MKFMNVTLIKKTIVFKTAISLLFVLISQTLYSQTTLDDFTDGDFSANPVWTVGTGAATITSNALTINTSIVKISTPFTTACAEWLVDLRSSSSFNTNRLRYYFVLINNSDPANATADGYCIEYSSSTGDIWLKRLDNGVTQADGSALRYFNGSEFLTTARTIRITRNSSNQFEIFVNGTSRITATDGTYSSSSVQFQSFWVLTSNTYTWTIDNIRYISACFNPAAPGVIANAQSSCGSFDPSTITSSSPASGETGTLEYKWQQSTTSAVAGFTDIIGATAATYDPPVLSQTTWFKRIARVDCRADWTGAAESNVIEITVVNPISQSETPVNDTVYNQLGTASFGVGIDNPLGATFQWQVSTNGGGSWSNVSNGGNYSGATTTILQVSNPTYAMNSYQYRCVVTNACGSVNSPAATLSVLPITTFSNTTAHSCGSNYGNTWGNWERDIIVTGLPTTLGPATGQYILRQVDLQLGSASCKKDLRSYSARIISPEGTIIDLFEHTSTTITLSPIWLNMKFRDHESLERLDQYSNNVQTFYYPYSIGYYAIQTDGAFSSVNGEDPNGTWKLQIRENISAGNEISFGKIELHFGPRFNINDVTSTTDNDVCSQATCISSQEIIIGTNNGYSAPDPVFPGLTTDGCSWNGANNDSAWFKFVASQSTAYLTLSGIRAATTATSDTQPLVFSMTDPCVTGFSVPTGGCPDDQSINNLAYLTANGGGIAIDVYTNGITANAEFNLSGLTVGQTYYLYVDGNGGASSTFYLEALFGCETCNTPLPVTLTSFTTNCNDKKTVLNWTTASEQNNDYFTLERSIDGTDDWRTVATVSGNGSTYSSSFYQWTDLDRFYGIRYYRLSQTDYDGQFEVLKVISSDCGVDTDGVSVLPNPNNGEFTVTGIEEGSLIQIVNITGQVVYEEITTSNFAVIQLNACSKGIYFLRSQTDRTNQVTKFIVK